MGSGAFEAQTGAHKGCCHCRQQLYMLGSCLRNYSKELYANKLENLEKMDKLLDEYNLLRLHQEDTCNLSRPIISDKIKQ